MIEQREDETRLEYLSRVLTAHMDEPYQGIFYDGALCDGVCLAEDIRNEIESLPILREKQ